MTVAQALEKLAAYEKLSFTYQHAYALLYYDGETVAPRGSAELRADTLGELARLSYELTTAPDTVEMIRTLEQNRDRLDAVTARKAAELWRDYQQTHRIPQQEFVDYQTLCSRCGSVWHEAKERGDYAMFEPLLQQMFDATRRLAACREPDKDPYDAQLDQYERGLTRQTCDRFFAALRQELVPLIDRVQAHAERVDDSPLQGDFPVDIQRRLTDYVMDIMDIDRQHCVVGETEHPFTTNFSKADVRITTHYHADLPMSSLYSVVHEGGHALYELHTADQLQRSCLGGGVSMGIHESQSRFYENIIGRSRAFCGLLYPWMKEHFAPRLDGVSEDAFYRMVNRAQPSLIRTEADELTYCLHIMVRYELEKRMFSGELTAHDLPAEWSRLYREYLGIEVPNDREGVLQDSHWSGGLIGYFPSYAIGSAYGAQYLREMEKEFDVYEAVRSGKLTRINRWLEEKIWRHGCMMDPAALFESVCGPFDPGCYTAYLRDKFTEVYGL